MMQQAPEPSSRRSECQGESSAWEAYVASAASRAESSGNIEAAYDRPVLRPLEAFRLPDDADPEGEDSPPRIGVRDRSGLSGFVLALSEPVLQILGFMDGMHDRSEIRRQFRAKYGLPLAADVLDSIIEQLDRAHFLEGPGFEAFYASKQEEYRRSGSRAMSATAWNSAVIPELPRSERKPNPDASPPIETGNQAEHLRRLFDQLLQAVDPVPLSTRPPGIVAPHLDYARGGPCYASAYATLRDWPPPDCVIILGTNHFGRSSSVVATSNDFATPLGTTATDLEFITRLELRLGAENCLRTFELDHAAEHSVELQVAWLQYLFGADAFCIVPLLCPDPCGPSGTAPFDGKGVDLTDFARTLRETIDRDPREILVVAGADLSHVGPAFGDHRAIDQDFLDAVRERDLRALGCLELNDPASFLRCVASDGNSTRVCSAGCLFVLSASNPRATATILRYHQAVDPPSQTCVTCTAAAFV